MSNKERMFLQSLSIDGVDLSSSEFDVSLEDVASIAYIEQFDLSGSTLTLAIRDANGLFRDNIGLGVDSELVAVFGDLGGLESDHFKDTFAVFSVAPHTDDKDVLVVEAFQKDVEQLKIKAAKPRFFTNLEPRAILKELAPNLTIDCRVSGVGTYHLNQGKAPSRLIRNMARDYGAAAFVCRGTLYMLPLSSFGVGEPVVRFGHNTQYNDENIDTQIHQLNRIDVTKSVTRKLCRNFAAWSPEAGLVSSGEYEDKPTQLLALPITRNQLSNQAKFVVPVLDVVAIGQLKLKPFDTVKVEVVKFDANAEVDHSVPSLLGIQTITHFCEGTKYNNRIVLGVVHRDSN